MILLNDALPHKEDWNAESVYESLLVALSFMNQKDFKTIQLILFDPCYVQSKKNATGSIVRQMKDSSHDEELITEIYLFIKEYFPKDANNKPLLKVNMFSTIEPLIVKDEWTRSVSLMFDRIIENIEALKSENVFPLYLISNKDYESLNFKNQVPFVNCIRF